MLESLGIDLWAVISLSRNSRWPRCSVWGSTADLGRLTSPRLRLLSLTRLLPFRVSLRRLLHCVVGVQIGLGLDS